MKDLTPQQIVRELDRYIVGQAEAKRAVAIAMRNRFRRLALPSEIQAEITPKNILMIGPTGVGKTEIARRLAKLADAPFIKVEATKFTQVGYVGRDVESIIRDLMDIAVGLVHDERVEKVHAQAEKSAEERIIDIIMEEAFEKEMPSPSAARSPAPPKAAASSAATAKSGAGKPAAPAALSPAQAMMAQVNAAETPTDIAHVTSPKARRLRQKIRKSVAERLAQKELEDQIIEIELDPEEGYSSMFEFVAGMASEDVGDGFQEFLTTMPGTRRRNRRVPVKEARRLLTQEEANRLVDLDSVIEEATQRVEQSGVVFLDEIDKIVGGKSEIGPDVSGEGVQRDLLPIVEGSTVMTRFGSVKTDHILWIAAGAFHNARPADLIPELQGRLPLRVELAALGEEDYKRILIQPENALTRQYEALLGVENVSVEFTPDGLDEIARCAQHMNERVENIGARRLQTIMEKVLEDVSFNATEMGGEQVTVNADFVRDRLEQLLADEDLSRYIL